MRGCWDAKQVQARQHDVDQTGGEAVLRGCTSWGSRNSPRRSFRRYCPASAFDILGMPRGWDLLPVGRIRRCQSGITLPWHGPFDRID